MAQWQKPSNERANANKYNHERPQDELARMRAAKLYDAILYEVVNKIVDQRALSFIQSDDGDGEEGATITCSKNPRVVGRTFSHHTVLL